MNIRRSAQVVLALLPLARMAMADSTPVDLTMARPPAQAESVAAATDVTISGKVVSTSGAGLVGFITAYRSSDKVIVATGRSGESDASGSYSISLPPGTYDFYVRNFGSKPIEVKSLVVTGPTVQNFTIDTAADRSVPSYLTKSRVGPRFVFISTAGSTSTFSLTANTSLGSSVAIFNEFAAFTVDGQSYGVIDLYDDGTHGDAVAGDRVYSRSGIGFTASPAYRCGSFSSALFLYARISAPAAGIVRVPDASLIGVKPPAATVLTTGDAKYTAYSASVIADTSKSGWEKEAARQFYKSFADVYDFLYFFPETSLGAAGLNIKTRNQVTGIGLQIFDDSALYGSSGVLQAVSLININESPPLLHETMHRWADWINPPFDATYLAHWGYSGVNGMLGGFDPAKLVANSDGSYTVDDVSVNGFGNDTLKYAPLERYLAGLAPPGVVPKVPVFTNVQIVNNDDRHFRGTRSDVSVGDIVNRYGPRSPAYPFAQNRFRVALVGVATTPMNDAGLAYLNTLARQFSGLSEGCITAISFATATENAATVDASIQLRSASRHHRAARH